MKLTLKIHEAIIILLNNNSVMNLYRENNDDLGLGTNCVNNNTKTKNDDLGLGKIMLVIV